MTTEDVRVRLRSKLEAAFGAEEASILMDRPPGGWSDLVTNQVLEAKLDALQFKLLGEMSRLRADVQRELRAQTWRLAGLVLVAFGIFATLVRVL